MDETTVATRNSGLPDPWRLLLRIDQLHTVAREALEDEDEGVLRQAAADLAEVAAGLKRLTESW